MMNPDLLIVSNTRLTPLPKLLNREILPVFPMLKSNDFPDMLKAPNCFCLLETETAGI